MGNNHSKLCSGDPDREMRRAGQESLQRLLMTQQARGTSSDTEQDTVHIYCHEDELDQFLGMTNAASIMVHLKVEKVLEIKPENPLEGGETQPLAEKLGAAEIADAVLAGTKVTEPGRDVTEKSEPSKDVMVTLESDGDIMVGTDAQSLEQDLPVVKKSFRVSSERTKHSVVEDLSPSSPEHQFTILSSCSQNTSPPIGAAELLNAGEVHHTNEDAFLANDQKAPQEIGLEPALENVLGAAEEPATGQMRIEEGASAENLEEAGKAPPELGSAEASDECSDAKTDLGMKELVEVLLSLGNDLPRAASEPPSILIETEERVPEGYCEEETMRNQLEVLLRRAQGEMLAMVDSEDEVGWPSKSKISWTCESHEKSVRTLCKKTNGDDILVSSDAVDVDPLQVVGASPTAEAAEGNESVVQNTNTQPSTDIAEMTMVMSSSDTLLETPETGQGGPLFSSAEPTAQVSRREDFYPGAQLSPEPVSVSGPPLEGGSPGQRC